MTSNFEKVLEWNKRCGKLPEKVGTDAFWFAIEKQMERIAEESREVLTEIRDRNLNNLIPEICDLEFTVLGLAMMTQHNHQEAMSRIFASNDTKYTRYFACAEESQAVYLEKGMPCKITESVVDGVSYFSIHKTSDDKILKLKHHEKTVFEDLVPENVKNTHVMVVYADNCTLCAASEEWLKTSGVKFERLSVDDSHADYDFCEGLGIDTYGTIVIIDKDGCDHLLVPKKLTALTPLEVFDFLDAHGVN